jgi:hypothetical protein
MAWRKTIEPASIECARAYPDRSDVLVELARAF